MWVSSPKITNPLAGQKLIETNPVPRGAINTLRVFGVASGESTMSLRRLAPGGAIVNEQYLPVSVPFIYVEIRNCDVNEGDTFALVMIDLLNGWIQCSIILE